VIFDVETPILNLSTGFVCDTSRPLRIRGENLKEAGKSV
jgi:hypothetical protein